MAESVQVMAGVFRFAIVAAAAVSLTGCGANFRFMDRNLDAPAYTAEVLDQGFHYIHNWPSRPCFTFDLFGEGWEFMDSSADRVRWKNPRRQQVLAVYFTDNRTANFAIQGMGPERILRSFLAYELEYVQRRFQFHTALQPRFSPESHGLWMSWGWEGTAGRRYGVKETVPTDQVHSVASLWLDPFVLSFDWATHNMEADRGLNLDMVEVLESVVFHPQCFAELKAGSTIRR